ncbi:alpha/beta hydrolase [Massilia sp. H-1]|nr:alpha/beta hydrolase [Massilia sp. H-1]
MKRACATLALVLVFGPAALAAPFDGMVDVGSHQLHVVHMGEGPYTVVFEARLRQRHVGLAQGRARDREKGRCAGVFARWPGPVAKLRQYGMPVEQSAAEFEQMLAAVKAKGPFILVGHSYGAFLIRLYAARHPANVA